MRDMSPFAALLLAIWLVVAACSISGCADMKKEDKDTITDILALPFRLIGM